MSSDEKYVEFKTSIKTIVEKILVDKSPYDVILRPERNDYGQVQYMLREYTSKKYKKMQLWFYPIVQPTPIAERDHDVYLCRYTIMLRNNKGDVLFARLERRPKRKLIFKRKPYQSDESFMQGLLTQIVQSVSPITCIETEDKKRG